MTSEEKKLWKKPALHTFADADEAIAFYNQQRRPEMADAVRKLAAKVRDDPAG